MTTPQALRASSPRRRKLRVACFRRGRRKLARSAAPPIQIEPTSLGLDLVCETWKPAYLPFHKGEPLFCAPLKAPLCKGRWHGGTP